MIAPALTERFAALFSGYQRAHGFTDPRKQNERGKLEVRSWTEHASPTLAKYQNHLDGVGPGLGIIMLREDETCLFGVIDVDDYKVDHSELEKKILKLNLPLVLLRSKSGGAHLVCFCLEPVDAALIQRKLTEWVALLGYSAKTEVFPKQTQRVSDEDTGNWINLPYYRAESTLRYGLFQGAALSLPDFCDYAESKRVTLEELERVLYSEGEKGDLYYEGPPCLQHLHATGGFVQGTMRDGMFDVGVYLRKRYSDDWDDRLATYNATMCEPPLRNEEIQDLIKQLKKKDYGYKCKQAPIADVCQRKLCLSRRYGVGDAGPQAMGLEITAVTRYQVEGTNDPPTWGMEIAGRRILIDNNTFYERDAFNKACLAAISRVPIHVPPARWLRMVNELAASADVIFTPKEASEEGNLWEWVVAYIVGAKAKSMDQIAVGGAFHEEGYVYFRVLDLFQFLDTRRVKYKKKQDIYHLLKEHGGETKFTTFKRGAYNVWKIPAPQQDQTESSVVSFKEPDTPF